jgi:hypothetical protein
VRWMCSRYASRPPDVRTWSATCTRSGAPPLQGTRAINTTFLNSPAQPTSTAIGQRVYTELLYLTAGSSLQNTCC